MTWKVICGDALSVLPTLAAGSVDAVVCDPPYPGEFLPILASAWREAARVVKDDGWLFVMSGQFYLRDVMHGIESAGWQYCWCGNFSTPHANTAIWPRGISAGWKPLLIYGKSRLCFNHWKYDTISPNTRNIDDKENHKWGQSEGQFSTLIRRFDIEGTVLDPFCGSGTTGVACIQTGRNFIGIEISSEYCEIARRRCREAEEAFALYVPPRGESQEEMFTEEPR